MVEEHHLSRVRACKAVGLPRSALYKPPQDRASIDAPVIDAINAVVEKRIKSGKRNPGVTPKKKPQLATGVW
jgi:hypothetical protein